MWQQEVVVLLKTLFRRCIKVLRKITSVNLNSRYFGRADDGYLPSLVPDCSVFSFIVTDSTTVRSSNNTATDRPPSVVV
jgi:hypothetical protein